MDVQKFFVQFSEQKNFSQMKNKLLPTCFFIVIFAFSACEENNAPILTGDVDGSVSVFDGYGYSLPDRSGVQVQLTGEDVVMEGATDEDGRYSFEDIPFGNYRINLVKENYIEGVLDFRLSHAGGDAPTRTSQVLNEIPEYGLAIDSIIYNGYNTLFFYLKAAEADTSIVSSSIYVNCFFSESPDVSYENYDHSFIGVIYNQSANNVFEMQWTWWYGSDNFLNDYTGTLYCRVYPQTYFYEMWPEDDSSPYDVIPETLGKPSEVFSFDVD